MVSPRRTMQIADIVARVLSCPPRLGDTRLVCIDGPSGSGKTTLAATLAAALAAPVVHMDDVYAGWDEALTERTWQVVREHILEPVADGRPGVHPVHDWTGGPEGLAEVPSTPVLLIEGVGAAQHRIRERACLVVWIEAQDDARRLERVIARDGEQVRDPMQRFLRAEAEHFDRDGTRAAADLHVDGDPGIDVADGTVVLLPAGG